MQQIFEVLSGQETTADKCSQAVIHHQGKLIAVAQCGDENSPNLYKGQANARLIAAAPDLLAALMDCLTDKGAMAYKSHEYAIRRLEAISSIAQNMIDKATGDKL